jgi:hypothetical protein
MLKEILQLDGFESETKFETIEQMIKSNLLNYFLTNQTNKSDQLRQYISSIHNNKNIS